MRSGIVRIDESRVEVESIDLVKFRPEALGWHFRYPHPSELLPFGPYRKPFKRTLVCQWLDKPSCSQSAFVSPETSNSAPPNPRPAVTNTLVPPTTGSGALTPIGWRRGVLHSSLPSAASTIVNALGE